MPTTRITMRKLRDVLRLRLSGGLSIREISRITKLSVRIESRQRFTDLLIPLSGLVVGRHSRYETALESKIVTRPLFHTPNPDYS